MRVYERIVRHLNKMFNQCAKRLFEDEAKSFTKETDVLGDKNISVRCRFMKVKNKQKRCVAQLICSIGRLSGHVNLKVGCRLFNKTKKEERG